MSYVTNVTLHVMWPSCVSWSELNFVHRGNTCKHSLVKILDMMLWVLVRQPLPPAPNPGSQLLVGEGDGSPGGALVVSLHLLPIPSPHVLSYNFCLCHPVVQICWQTFKRYIYYANTLIFALIRNIFIECKLPYLCSHILLSMYSQEVGVNVGFVTNKEFLPRNSATSEFNLISKMIVGKLLKYLEKIAHSSKNDENVILDRISFKGLWLKIFYYFLVRHRLLLFDCVIK